MISELPDYDTCLYILDPNGEGLTSVDAIEQHEYGLIVTNFDVNGDGKYTVEDNVAYWAPKGVSEEDARRNFSSIDKNGDGEITLEDIIDPYLLVTNYFRGNPLGKAATGDLWDYPGSY